MNITVTDTALLTPTGGIASNTPIKIVCLEGYDQVLTGAISEFTTDDAGAYSFPLYYGVHAIYVRFDTKFKLLGKVTITSELADTATISDLLLYTEPMLPDEIALVSGLVEEARGYAEDAESAATQVGERLASYEVETTEYLINTFDSSALLVGGVVKTLGFYEKGGLGAASWVKVSSSLDVSKSPSEYWNENSQSPFLTSSNGDKFTIIDKSTRLLISQLGGIGDFSSGEGTSNDGQFGALINSGMDCAVDMNIGISSTHAIPFDLDIDFMWNEFGPLSGMPLTESLIYFNGINNGYDVATETTIKVKNVTIDGAAREYIKYLSDPETGEEITDPETNKTRNPDYDTRGYLIAFRRCAGWELNGINIKNNQTISILDSGCKNQKILNVYAKDCGKLDDVSSVIVQTSFSTSYRIKNITSTNPAVIELMTLSNIATGTKIHLAGLEGLASEAEELTVTNIGAGSFSIDGLDATSYSYIRSNRHLVTTSAFVHSEGGLIDNFYGEDLKNSAMSLSPTKGGTCSNVRTKNTGEAAVWVADSVNLNIYNLNVDGTTISDVTANGLECGRSYGLNVIGGVIKGTSTAAIDLQGSEAFNVKIKTMDIIPDGVIPVRGYGPTAEGWTGTTQGTTDNGGLAVSDPVLSHIKLANLDYYECKSGVLTPLCYEGSANSALKQLVCFSSNDAIDDGVLDINIENGVLTDNLQESDFENGKIATLFGNPSWDTINIKSNLGHASNNIVTLREAYEVADSGENSVYFGFPPSNINITVYQTSANANNEIRECVGFVSRNEVFSITKSISSTSAYQITNINSFRVRQANSALVASLSSFEITKDGVSFNIDSISESISVTFEATP